MYKNKDKDEENVDDKYWYIYGQKYDLNEFIKKHPGGEIALLCGKGRDCTILFEQYHTLNDNHYKVLDKYKKNEDKSIYDIKKNDKFYEDIKNMVRDYKKEGNDVREPTKLVKMIVYTLIILVGFLWYLWACGYWFTIFLLPFLYWQLTSLTAHDAAHFSYTKNKKLNYILSFTSIPILWNNGPWYLQHNVSHHQHTNKYKKDVDMNHGYGFYRMSKEVKYKNHYRIQIFSILLIINILTNISLAYIYPILLILKKTNLYHEIENKHVIMNYTHYSNLIQLIITTVFIIYPFVVFNMMKAILFVLVPWIITSILFSFYTQISHLQDDAIPENFTEYWSINQVKTSVDYKQDSLFFSTISGSLNMQSLHHLLPGINSSHLYYLYPTYRKICEKHNIQILEKKNILEAYIGFIKHGYNLQFDY